MIPFLNLRELNANLAPKLIEAAERVVQSGYFVLGPEVEALELELAASQGVAHAVGVGNGLDALALALMAIGVGPGDEVIVPSHTFIATWLAVTRTGATLVPVDVSSDDYNLDPALVEAAIGPRTRAIVPVHLYGRPALMVELRRIATRHNLNVIADGAQSIGSTIHDRPVATFADATTLSFYPGKNLGALGDGGAVLTDDEEVAKRVRTLRNYGSSVKYVHEEVGMNSRLDEMQAAFLRVKLPHLVTWNARRSEVADAYLRGMEGLDLTLPPRPVGMSSAWHLFVVRTRTRQDVQERLAASGISTLIHYPLPPGRQLAYSGDLYSPMPVADQICDEVLSLPMCPTLTDADVQVVIDGVTAACGVNS